MSSFHLYAKVKTHYPWLDDFIKTLIRKNVSLCTFVTTPADLPCVSSPYLQFTDGVDYSLDHVLANPSTSLVNCYPSASALVRKDYLVTTVKFWNAKYPKSILADSFPESVAFELDYAEFLDDALDETESWEMRMSLGSNAVKQSSEREWWVLKPSLTDCGYGIQLFSTEDSLRQIFEEQGEQTQGDNSEPESGCYSNQLRQYVAQRYIQAPFLLNGRKFHLRSYAVACGWLKVFVYREMFALVAPDDYNPPSSSTASTVHLTNTHLQGAKLRDGSIQSFWDIGDQQIDPNLKESIFSQLCRITAEIFRAAAGAMPSHFQLLPNAFELFGLDSLVDERGKVWLLEINAGPGFKPRGGEYDEVVKRLFEAIMSISIRQFFQGVDNSAPDADATKGMVCVLDQTILAV